MADESKLSSISKASTYEEMGEFWDTHSLADYDDQTYEVEMTFEPSARRNFVTIEAELFREIRELSRSRHVTPETLINVWLRQQVDEVRMQTAVA